MNSRWQWMDDNFGPMGWFSDEGRKELEASAEFKDHRGHWREIPAEERESMHRCHTAAAYEQS